MLHAGLDLSRKRVDVCVLRDGGELVDQMQRDINRLPPRLGQIEPLQQLAAGEAEQIRDRAGLAEVDQRRVDPLLQHRTALSELFSNASIAERTLAKCNLALRRYNRDNARNTLRVLSSAGLDRAESIT